MLVNFVIGAVLNMGYVPVAGADYRDFVLTSSTESRHGSEAMSSCLRFDGVGSVRGYYNTLMYGSKLMRPCDVVGRRV